MGYRDPLGIKSFLRLKAPRYASAIGVKERKASSPFMTKGERSTSSVIPKENVEKNLAGEAPDG